MSFFPNLSNAGTTLQPANARLVKHLRHNSPFLSCRFDPTGRYVFGGAQDSSLQRRDLSTHQKTTLAGHQGWIRSMAFAPRGGKLISSDYHGKLIWWNYTEETPRPVHTIDAHDGWVRAVAVHPSQNLVASCGNDRLVKLWNLENGQLIRTIAGHDSHVYNVGFHPDGNHLVSADHRGVIKSWDLNGRMIRTFDASVLQRYDNTFRAIIGGARGLAFKADGSQFAVAGITNVSNAFAGIGDPCVILFNWESGARVKVFRARQAFRGTAWGVAFHPEGFLVAAGGGAGGALWFWRENDEQDFAKVTLPSNAFDMDLHSDNQRIAAALSDNSVRVYDMRTL